MEHHSLAVWLAVPRSHFLRPVGGDVVEDNVKLSFGVGS